MAAILLVDYARQKVFVRRIMTHEEYDDGGWQDDPWL
jgi:mRNA-degrading endonuclease HigB of HigAB toxin-antitoxin module